MSDRPYIQKRSSAAYPGGSRLSQLDIELTERCNNACQHCYINLPALDQAARARELTAAQWQDILRQAAGLGALTVRITGGEPLLREDFSQIYLFARRLGLRVLLFTNARLVTPALADLFARIPPLEPIEVTVYGMRPASYDAAARAPGAYLEFRRGLDLLLDRHVPFIVKGALLPSNRAEIGEFEAWAATLPWMKEAPSYSMFFDLRGRRDSETRNRRIRQLRLAPEEGVRVLTRHPESYRAEMHRFCRGFIGPAGTALFTCGAGQRASVDAYGNLQPCLLLRDPTLARDLRSLPLRDGLDYFSRDLPQIQAADPRYLERCAVCFLHGLCEQCPAKAWSEHGVLDRPVEYLCEVAHARARDLGLLLAGEKAWEVRDWRKRLDMLDNPSGG